MAKAGSTVALRGRNDDAEAAYLTQKSSARLKRAGTERRRIEAPFSEFFHRLDRFHDPYLCPGRFRRSLHHQCRRRCVYGHAHLCLGPDHCRFHRPWQSDRLLE